jgi:hypothetical protein
LRAPIGSCSVCLGGVARTITPFSVSAATLGAAICPRRLNCPFDAEMEFALRRDGLKLRLYANAEGVENALRGVTRA